MAKIRGVKPEFWTDDAIVELSRDARLLFIGLWNFACDNGHLDDKPKQIKMRILPADDVDVDALLAELESQSRIIRKNGTITIPKFASHQKPHKRWWTTCGLPWCRVPDGTSQQSDNEESTVEQPLRNGGPTVTDVTDGDGDGDSERRAPRRRSPECPLPGDWTPNDGHRAYAQDNGLDLEREAFKFRNHADSNDRRQRDWDAAFRTWLARAVEYAPPKSIQQTRQARAHLPEAWQ